MLDLEIVRWVVKPDGQRIPVKRDQAGSDLLIFSLEEIIFVQVKGGKSAVGGTFPAARRTFAEFVFPPTTKQWVVAWAPRARAPRIVDCYFAGSSPDRHQAKRDRLRRVETELF